ncbi:MAG: hypothetical protein HC820_08495 [Hydrococcus sp. RM1_1_31]|nr:hypothetical protein [Hydrococcus sp. RM1_1_31]
MKFNTVKQHNATVKLIADNPPIVANPIANFIVDEDAPDTILDLSNVFVDSDGTAIVKTVLVNSNGQLVTTNLVDNTLTLDYQSDRFGTADITIRGTSGGKTVDDTFTVTVNPVDDAPVVANAIANVTVNENAPNTTINLSNVFSDIDNDTAAISKAVVKTPLPTY